MKSNSAYRAALKNKILDTVCAHMPLRAGLDSVNTDSASTDNVDTDRFDLTSADSKAEGVRIAYASVDGVTTDRTWSTDWQVLYLIKQGIVP